VLFDFSDPFLVTGGALFVRAPKSTPHRQLGETTCNARPDHTCGSNSDLGPRLSLVRSSPLCDQRTAANHNQNHGTHLPVEESSTASIADLFVCLWWSGDMKKWPPHFALFRCNDD